MAPVAIDSIADIRPGARNCVGRANVFRPRRWGIRFLFIAALVPMAHLRPSCGFAKNKAERPPFDLTYVPADAMGVIALRPNVIFRDPAMRPLAQMANLALTQLLKSYQLPVDPKLRIEEIEQMVGYFSIKPNKKESLGFHQSVVGPVLIRTVHDFDWPRVMSQLNPRPEEIRGEKRNLYIWNPESTFSVPHSAHIYFFMPDKRTLVIPADGTNLAAMKSGKIGQRASFSWDKDWQSVERCLFAIAMDNRWARGLSKEQIGGEEPMNSLIQSAATMIAGVDWKNGVDFSAALICKDRENAQRATRIAETMRKGVIRYTEQFLPPPQGIEIGAGRQKAADFQLIQDLAEQARIILHETTVYAHSNAKVNLAEFAKSFLMKPGMRTPPTPPPLPPHPICGQTSTRSVLIISYLSEEYTQRELKLTQRQLAKIQKIRKDIRSKHKKELEKAGVVEDSLAPPTLPGQRFSISEYQKLVEKMRVEEEEALLKVLPDLLKLDQLKRLQEISLQEHQLLDLSILLAPAVVGRLKLTKEQQKKIVFIVKEVRADLNKKMSEAPTRTDIPIPGATISLPEILGIVKVGREKLIATVLTIEQKKIWKDMLGKPFHFGWESDEPVKPGL